MANKYRDTNRQQRVTIVIGIILVIAMAASAILPLLQSSATFTQPIDEQPTARPQATVPPPQDTASISFDEQYIHPTGLFDAAVPTGYQVTTEYNDVDEAQVVMRNPEQLSVAEIRVLSGDDVASAEDLEALFTSDWLQSSWREYSSWDESRRVVNEDGQLEMDFTLRRGNQSYIARQIAWVEGSYVYMTRVVTPDNASESLRYILNNLASSVEPNAQYAQLPLDWGGYYDEQNGHIIRYPANWTLADAAPGVPASITADGVSMRVEAREGSVDSADAAAALVEEGRAGVSVLSTEEVDQNGSTGYRVTYSLTTPDGAAQSGAVVILNGTEGMIHVADLRLDTGESVDLNSDDAAESYADAITSLATFALIGENEDAS